MTTVYVIRHAHVAERDYSKGESAPLSARGRSEAQKLARTLTVDLVVSSSYFRARETAEILGAELGVPTEIEVAFGEINMGGFTLQGLLLIGKQTFDKIIACVEGPKSLLIVSHLGLMRALYLFLTDTKEDTLFKNLTGFVFEVRDGKARNIELFSL